MWPETIVLPSPSFDLFPGIVIDKNQWAVKNSSRKLPLNDSISALSVGFPGREKSNHV
jgi:hypothetical protein